MKHVSLHNYHKETGDLKVRSEKDVANKHWKTKVRSETGSESFSWRKKSNDTNNVLSSGYNSHDKSSNYSRHNDSGNFKRERFNSEGNNKLASNNRSNYTNTNELEEIEIDVTNLKYSLTSKSHRLKISKTPLFLGGDAQPF